MYIVVYEAKEVISFIYGENIITREGTKCVVCEEPSGFVEATGKTIETIDKSIGEFPKSCKVFETTDEVKEFMLQWEGHPWYLMPNGNFEIKKVVPVLGQVLIGYETYKD